MRRLLGPVGHLRSGRCVRVKGYAAISDGFVTVAPARTGTVRVGDTVLCSTGDHGQLRLLPVLGCEGYSVLVQPGWTLHVYGKVVRP